MRGHQPDVYYFLRCKKLFRQLVRDLKFLVGKYQVPKSNRRRRQNGVAFLSWSPRRDAQNYAIKPRWIIYYLLSTV